MKCKKCGTSVDAEKDYTPDSGLLCTPCWSKNMPNLQIVHTESNWEAMIRARNSGRMFQCDEDVYYYWLGVLPPIYMNKKIVIEGRECRCFGSAEGVEKITNFWTEGGKYFGKRSHVWHDGQ